MAFYHDGNRRLQAQFGSTALADRLVERVHRGRFTDADKGFIESVAFFLLATADYDGRPDCSFKGGAPGFVRVVASDLLEFPDYDGNGMFRSLGNITVNPHVALLFITMDAAANRPQAAPSLGPALPDRVSATRQRDYCWRNRSSGFRRLFGD